MSASKIVAINFFEDLSSRYSRRWFFWGFFSLCVLSSLLIFLTLQFVPVGISQVILTTVWINVLAGSLIILAVYCLYFYFIGPQPLREVSVTRSEDIGALMESLPLGVSHYMFWGRSGSFFRAYPLLKLDEQARENKTHIDIEIVLPDPTDKRLLTQYQEILNALKEETNHNTLLVNVLATSIACGIISANNTFVNIKIFYSKFLPAFRVDISDKGAILTQDDPKKSALFFKFKSEFYEMFKTTFRNESSVSTEVKWDETLFKGRSIGKAICDVETLNAFGIDIKDVDTGEIQKEVASLITEQPHRYK